MLSMDDLLLILNEPESAKETKRTYVRVIVPLPLPKLYTYSVPFHLIPEVKIGVRVEVQLGRNGLYAALVYEIHQETPDYQAKPILAVLDEEPVVTEKQFRLWDWMSEYYVCTMGEVMQAALPAGLKLAGETRLVIYPDYQEVDWLTLSAQFNNKETFIVEELQRRGEISVGDLQKLMNQKTIQPFIKTLLEKKIVFLKEELQERYKAKKVSMVTLAEPYSLTNPASIKAAFEVLGTRSNRQMETFMAYIQLAKQKKEITRKELQEKAGVDSQIVKKIGEKGIFHIYDVEVSRLGSYEEEGIGNYALSEMQQTAFDEVIAGFEEKNVVLLHGVPVVVKPRSLLS